MFDTSSGMGPADFAAMNGGNNSWDWVLILLFLGILNRGFGSGNGCDSACATVGDVERGFNQQSTNQRFNAIDGAFAQLGYNQQQQGYETRLAITNAQAANQACCCETQRAIDGVNYNMSQGFCNLGNAVQAGFAQIGYNEAMNTNAIMQNAHSDTDRVLAKLDAMENARQQERIHSLEMENQSLKFQASQTAQNAFISANQDAQTAEILRRTGHDCPTAAYVVQPPTPVTFPNFCNTGCNAGCCAA